MKARDLESVIKGWVDPVLKQTLADLKVKIKAANVDDRWEVTLFRHYLVNDDCVWKQQLIDYLAFKIKIPVKILVKNIVVARASVAKNKHPKIKNIVAILSGKGGVGKSTITANLAVALVSQGYKVGVLDADIHGPSQLLMLDAASSNEMTQVKDEIRPTLCHGVHVASMGALLKSGQAVAWRGPLASKALVQLYQQTDWPDLDFLCVDCPPGTSDILLTLSKDLPLIGSVLVTTPQLASVIDADRAADLMQKLSVPILGIVENMSHHQCNKCGHVENTFGSGGGRFLANKFKTNCWQQIPLKTEICQGGEDGKPWVLDDSFLQSLAVDFTQSQVGLAKHSKLSSIKVDVG